jgi:flagellar motor switch protein FliM
MSAGALTHLAPGDVICLDRRCDRPLEVRVGDHPGFLGVPGRHKGRVAVMLQ